MQKLKTVDELQELHNRILNRRDINRLCIVTSVGTCGLARGAADIAQAITKELKNQALNNSIEFKATGCHVR
jgi:hypothetical protein